MLQWLSSLNEFEQWTELYHQAHGVYFDTLCILTAVTFAELQAVLPLPPDSNPFPSEPGPHEYWYCRVDNLPVLISHHHQADQGRLTYIRTFPGHSEQNPYFWSPLEKLIALPNPLMQRILWIGLWDQKKQPVRSLYSREAPAGMAVPVEIYQAETVTEAAALLSFLQSLHSEYNYYIDEPDSA